MYIGLHHVFRPNGLSLIRQLKTKKLQRWLSASRSLTRPPPRRRAVADESEDEDQPRIVLDVRRDFTLLNAKPSIPFKLHEFNPQQEGPKGEMIPFQNVLAVHPVPIPADVARAKAAMGHGKNGVWMGTRFSSSAPPDYLFPARAVNTSQQHVLERFCIRRRFAPQISSLKTMLMYTDGACLNQNHVNTGAPRGGSAFVFNEGPSGTFSFALENRGPDGQVYSHTNNRAELRAVIAALRFRHWAGEGWERIIVATDSEYVGKGATEWLRDWAGRDWHRIGSGRKPVANQDLWRALSDVLGSYADAGCEVSFWMVPRLANARADAAAKAAAENGAGGEEYRNTPGVMV